MTVIAASIISVVLIKILLASNIEGSAMLKVAIYQAARIKT